ncbi:restriction endonuclease subunit S [Phocaeicola vulgatus]|uniref:Restriction endonuclease subunit S n=1 Tax=Phocaeicola vulgatus TaxID=821 RepID=A0A415BRV0_PHOVU|nr:restriction endonuclease subunit S [Phocaeicola vulgatus]
MKKYDAYKDSEVKWIGEIPEHWEITPLKFCFKVLSGATPKSTELSYWEDGNINWITPADFKTEDRFISDGAKKITKEGFMSCSTTLIPSGSIIFSKRAPIGSVVINSNEVCTNQGCLSCIPKDDISSLFFYYIMSVSQKYFDMLGTGTTFNEISANVFKNVHLPVPPLSEQQAIASYLDAKTEKMDQMIAKTEKKIEYLGELKQSLITRAVTRGLNSNVPLKDSGVKWIGNVPKHWNIMRSRFLCSLKTGDKDTVNREENGTYPFYVRSPKIERINSYTFDGEAVLMAGDGVGAGKVFHYVNEKFDYHQRVYNFHNFKHVTVKYFFYYIRENFKYKIEEGGAKNTVDSVRKSMIQDFLVPIPPLSEQQQIATYLDIKCSKIDYIIATQKKKIAYLQELKQSLITNVVTGKIKVS